MIASTFPARLAAAYASLDMVAEMMSELRAEAGSGAMSLGYGVDGAYFAASQVREPDSAELRADRAIVADYADACALIRPVLVPSFDTSDDIPF